MIVKFLLKMGTPDYDLLPVSAVHQVLMLLKDVLESHDGVVAAVTDRKENFEKVSSSIRLLTALRMDLIFQIQNSFPVYNRLTD